MTAYEPNESLNPMQGTLARESVDDQHPLGKSVALHLIPGVALLASYILLTPLVVQMRFPTIFAGSLSILFVLAPLELGYLLYLGRRRNGRLSLAGIVRYREPMHIWQYALFVPLLVVWYSAVISAWQGIMPALAGALSWLPDWALNPLPADDPSAQYAAPILLTAAIFRVACTGIIAPVIEELYFRGYLLPRIDRLGVWAVVIGAVLFSFQHLWTPLLDPGRVIAWLPAVYLVWRKRNIYLGIIVHLALNLAGVILPLMS
ncbi:MAG TPA: CPBP family intramembrane glutamic endopeptidase [Rubrobacteraceae bacterium]|nr:CPBP family intramembrane glutamic endopeptidase [Rubrobacteraceae bacterium]